MDYSISTKRRRRVEDELISAAAAAAIDTSKVHEDTSLQKQQLGLQKQGAPQDNNDSIPLLQQLEQKRTQLEIELKKLNEQILSITINSTKINDETVHSNNNNINSSLLVAIENDCIAMIWSYLDPISLAQCELTSTKMKNIADSTWDTIEKNVCRMKCRSEEKTAKERIIRHTLASNFARKVEQRIMSNNGKNRFRDKLWNHSTYLPSHGIINEEHEYEMFVRFADGSKDCKISKDFNNWQANDIDENLLSQGFDKDAWSNYVLQSNYLGKEVPDLYLWMDLNLRDLGLFTEDPSNICSYKEKRILIIFWTVYGSCLQLLLQYTNKLGRYISFQQLGVLTKKRVGWKRMYIVFVALT